MQVFRKYWKSITWIIVIFILSSISGNSLDRIPKLNIPHFDKIVHFGLYFILTAVLVWDFSKYQESSFKISFFILIFSISYGVFIELMQEFFFIKRSADFYDFLANSAGSIIGLITYNVLLKKYRNHRI